MTFVLFRSCFRLFSPFLWSRGCWMVSVRVLAGAEGTLGCWREVNEGAFLQRCRQAKGTRDSEAPRGRQQCKAVTTPGPEGATGGNRATAGARGWLEPQERSPDSGSCEGHPLQHQSREGTGINTAAYLSSLLPFPAQASHWLKQGSLRTTVLRC